MELKGPETGVPADADPARRWPVKVLSARDASDPLGHAFDTPPSDDPLAVIEIGWGLDDALPFSLCVSAEITTADGLVVVGDVSAAVGNVLLADHGLTEDRAGPIGTVPFPALAALAQPRPGGSLVDDPATDACAPRPRLTIPPRFQPSLQAMNLTHAALVDDTSATSCLRSTPADARATVTDVESFDEDGTRITWSARFPDLLASGLEPVYVVEVDNALIGSLRFGDDTYGRRPTPGAQFTARARSGNGSAGNVGAGTITHVVLPVPDIVKPVLTNPLPATGGVDPQSIESVRREAPFAFRQQRRAVTREDYADQAGAFPGVQRASVNLRWTGSWHTHFVAIDRLGGGDPDQAFTDALGRSLEAVRLAGHDLQIERPRNVAIEITLRVYLGDNQLRGAVLQALQRALGSGDDGLFGPDRFTFGQPVYLSPVVAAAQAVPGVKAVQVVRFQRRDAPGGDGIAQGRLDVGRNEVARLDNDPNYPDRGVLSLILVGGR